MTTILSNNQFNFRSVKLLVIIGFLFFSFAGYSQNSCTQQLETAEKLYESGQIDKVAPLLKSCLENGFSKDERARAYRLLTLCNLYYNQDEEAKSNFLNLLKIDKEYKIKESDPSEFITLHDDFRTDPVFITGLKFGFGITDLYTIDNYDDINSIAYNGIYTPGYSYSLGLSFETPVFKDFSIAYEFYYNSYSYNFKSKVLDYANISFDETISGIDIPVLVQWNILSKDFVPYINVGASFNYLLSSNASYTRRDNEGTEYREPEYIDLDLTDSRNSINYSFCAGAGFRWKNILGKGYLTFDIRYSRYMNNIVDPSHRADNPEMIYSFFTTDNVFKVQNTQVMVGYKWPFYIPKYKVKLKKE